MNVTKYHGTGNDFVVVDAAADVPDRSRFARAVCNRETGISHPDSPRTGADGVLFLSLHADEQPPRIGMTLVQPDGSRAAMCGNGARCAADWAARRLGGAEEIVVDTGAGPRRAHVGDDVTIEMGEPTFELVDDVREVNVPDVGPDVRHADVFPEGANLTVASRREDGEGFDQRTYERGVEDETRSCGTGAVAVAAVAVWLGFADRGEPIAVHPPGGRLDVTVTDDGSTLRGPVVREFTADAGGD
ncbi:diaminopimelate epimerase [Halobacteriales archaeon SW_10_68_16]|nr:MAG: diaminopimelate epimerase [Halobacteriales archaeon SW_10_68_16]